VRLAERQLPGLLAWSELIFAPLSDGTLLAVEAATGRVVWSTMVGDLPEPLASSQLGSDGTLALRTQSAVVSLNASTGATRWSIAAPEFPPRPLVDGGRVYLASGSGSLSAVEASIGGSPVVTRARRIPHQRRSGSAGRQLVLDEFRWRLDCACPATGSPRWSRDVGGTLAPPVLGVSGLYVGTLAGDLYVVDPTTGIPTSQLNLGGAILLNPVSVGDVVYVSTDSEQGTTVVAVRRPG
jgi:outer membrane protein assembly factor BamB